jgi:protein archease
MSRVFRVLEHTADVGFEAYGSTRREVFANAARALTELMVDAAAIVPRERAEFQVEGDSPTGLLVNWLSEILYRFDAEGWLCADYEVMRLGERALTARARGEKFDRARHSVKVQVKAITYHQLLLEKTPQGWRARVFVDI